MKKENAMRQDINRDERQQAADRLMAHLLQKGRPAPYKERLIGAFADPDKGRMPEALIPIVGGTPLGVLQRLIFVVEGWIRRGTLPNQQKMPSGSKQTQ